MALHRRYVPIITLLIASLVFSAAGAADQRSETIRRAVWAGSFYPADPQMLRQTIEKLTAEAAESPVTIPETKQLKALILPHAGYRYSGLTAAHAARVIVPGMFPRVIVMGPDHRMGLKHAAITRADAYETPLGKINIHPDAQMLRNRSALFRSVPDSDAKEHSVEVILPFLQSYIGNFEFIPVVLGSECDLSGVTEAIAMLLDRDTLLVASSDLSHYLPYDQAVDTDQDTLRCILDLDVTGLWKKKNAACGKLPVLVIMQMARQMNWQAVLLHYSNSGDTAGDRSRVVGYGAVAFFGEPQ